MKYLRSTTLGIKISEFGWKTSIPLEEKNQNLLLVLTILSSEYF